MWKNEKRISVGNALCDNYVYKICINLSKCDVGLGIMLSNYFNLLSPPLAQFLSRILNRYLLLLLTWSLVNKKSWFFPFQVFFASLSCQKSFLISEKMRIRLFIARKKQYCN